jgi:glycosyltransferase involved in cell wall biosynthesis
MSMAKNNRENLEDPLVSICVVTYNQKNFIRETIDSALAQDYQNIEIIVADDGSTDGTAEIVEEYARSAPGKVVAVVGGGNLGITGNCNRGLSRCKGKYVAFLGGDDVFFPEKIRTQVEYMESNPECDVSYHDMEIFSNETGQTLNLFSRVSRPVNGSLREAIRFGTVNCASASMYRAAKIPDEGFDPSLPVVSDWYFTIQVLAAGGRFCYIPKVLGRYRRHLANVTNVDSPFRLQGYLDILQTCSKCMRYYPEHISSAISRMSAIMRESRKLQGGAHYGQYLRASLKLKFSMISLAGLMVYYISARRILL